MTLTYWLILFFAFIVVSNLITRDVTLSREDRKIYSYKKKPRVMTEHEYSFYKILDEALGGDYYILAQAHLSAFLAEKVLGQNWNAAFRHINGKSVDFLLCDKHSLEPLLAIELDDKTHEQNIRIKRDTEVEKILLSAQVPLLRMLPHGKINTLELLGLVKSKITESRNAPTGEDA